MTATAAGLPHRADIDGLRAVCVVAVLLCHASVPGFAGGYVGVDVFFVISGYLITRLLVERDTRSVTRRLVDFYVRRGRRILPALLVVLAACAGVSCVLLLPPDLVRFGRDLTLSTALVGNVGAMLDGGYFDPGIPFTPLRHLWSIAVEEQFYLAYPPLLFIVSQRFLPQRFALLATCTALSFALCVFASYRYPSANYYLLPTRAWQLFAGALLALAPIAVRGSRLASELFGWLGLAALIVAMTVFDDTVRYPGLNACMPTAAAVLLIASGTRAETTVARLLSLRPLVFTGLVSYSLYLWHLPVLTYVSYYHIVPASLGERGLALAASYLLAVASWRWIEQPVRRRTLLTSDRTFVTVAAIAMLALAAVGAVLWSSAGFPERFSPEVQTLSRNERDVPRELRQCMSALPTQIEAGELCRLGTGTTSSPRVVVWGDSHALALLPAYQAIAESRGLDLYFAMSASCRPLLGVMSPRQAASRREQCAQFNEAMVGAVRKLDPGLVILNAYWNYPDLDLIPEDMPDAAPDPTRFGPALARTLDAIDAPRRVVCAVRDVPVYEYPVPYALAMAARRKLGADFVPMSRDRALAQDQSVRDQLRVFEARGRLHSVDLKDSLCAEARCAVTTATGVPLYADGNHLSKAGAQLVTSVIAGCLGESR